MHESLYELYIQCFPDYPTTKDWFFNLLNPSAAHIIESFDENKNLIGFSMIHNNSISILCVKPENRNKGVGKYLLDESEKHIINSGADNIILGRGSYYLLQGVPNEQHIVCFFENRGYIAKWISVNMTLPLLNFNIAALNIPKMPPDVEFRFATKNDTEMLLQAVNDAEPSWVNVFKTCIDPILLTIWNSKIVGFEVLSPNGGRFTPINEKVGCIGCVGIIHEARELGIGRQMVVYGADWLKNQGCTSIELRYVELVDWYKKIGFTVIREQWMGEKKL